MKHTVTCVHCFAPVDWNRVHFLVEEDAALLRAFGKLDLWRIEDSILQAFLGPEWSMDTPRIQITPDTIPPYDEGGEERPIFVTAGQTADHPALLFTPGAEKRVRPSAFRHHILCPFCHCALPPALFREDVLVQKVGMFGSVNAGKTVMLMMLARNGGQEALHVMDPAFGLTARLALPREADLGYHLIGWYENALLRGCIPGNSSRRRWIPPVLLQLEYGGHTRLLAVYDVAGEEINALRLGGRKEAVGNLYMAMLEHVDDVVVLADPEDLRDRRNIPLLRGNEKNDTKLDLEQLANVLMDIPGRERERINLALAVTKQDLLKNADAFAGPENTLLYDLVFGPAGREDPWLFFDEEKHAVRQHLLEPFAEEYLGAAYDRLRKGFSQSAVFFTASLGTGVLTQKDLQQTTIDIRAGEKALDGPLSPVRLRELWAWLLLRRGFPPPAAATGSTQRRYRARQSVTQS